ncbi:MAG: glycosyltransferase family 2 protein [Bacillota bacterium]|nr:glycosyltransferase family 2 protein [Bacillota bacterium]
MEQSKQQSAKKGYSPKNPLISIIIPAFNQWPYTRQCLQSVLNNTCFPGLEVVLVDNASTDQTKEQLAQWVHPALRVISSSVNLGFSGGMNLGLRHANGDYLILLNNDTIVPQGWLKRLLRPLGNPDIGLAGPVTNYSLNEQKLDLVPADPIQGADASWLNEIYRFNQGSLRFTEFLTFFCTAMRRDLFETVGQMDEQFTVGLFEDNDYCERVKAAGYKLVIVDDAFVYHHGSISFNNMERHLYQSILLRNRVYYETKWRKPWQPVRHATPLQNNDPQEVADALSATEKQCVLLLSGRPWHGATGRCAQLVHSFLQKGKLVIVCAPSYYGRKIFGIRQAGRYFFLTNQTMLLEKSKIETIVYCGETTNYKNLKAERIYMDHLSYRST